LHGSELLAEPVSGTVSSKSQNVFVAAQTRVFLEIGSKRVFASAADWPGWSRGGKTEESALENLAAYAPRYAKVAKLAKIELPKDATKFDVVERIKGNGATDYGVPAVPARAEAKKLSAAEAERISSLVDACWKYLDQVRANAPAELTKGPRGGGRDRDKMFVHVVDSEHGYSRPMGLRIKPADPADATSVRALRKQILATLGDPIPDAKWSAAYAARRIAWHALDHAWEMEDRIP
jgi:hypothetical protein